MSELKKTCGYHGLLRDLAYYATGEWQNGVEQCPQEPAYYASIKTPAGDFEAELLRNLCAEHDQRVRAEVAGWQESRPVQVIDDYLKEWAVSTMTDTAVTTLTDASIAERVAAGAAWLDANHPGWLDRIDVDNLSMESNCYCVLGQLFGNYYRAPITLTEAIPLGFDTTVSVESLTDKEIALAEFELLTTEWTRVIEERRAVSA